MEYISQPTAEPEGISTYGREAGGGDVDGGEVESAEP